MTLIFCTIFIVYFKIDGLERISVSDISSEMGVQGALSPAGVRGVPALSPSPPSGLQARHNDYEEISERSSSGRKVRVAKPSWGEHLRYDDIARLSS